jgi:VCBS repeat-containing protein
MPDRFQIRRTTTKAVPDTDDLVVNELGYSFVSNNLFIKNPITGAIEIIGGRSLADAVALINKSPQGSAFTSTVFDTQNTVTGNLLTSMNISDADGDVVSILNFGYNGSSVSAGSSINSAYGRLTVLSNGDWSYLLSNAARALTTGNVVNELFTITFTDGRGALNTKPFTVQISGTQQAPIVTPSSGFAPYGQSFSLNVLQNVVDFESDTLTITEWFVLGIAEAQLVGSTVVISNVGSVSLTANGLLSFFPEEGFSGTVPVITYTVTDGVSFVTGTVDLFVAPPSVAFTSNPVSSPMSGVNRTFHVGPGQTMLHPDEVPWPSLTAGDVVNIYYRPEPYVAKIGVCGKGTASFPIVINGVTDSMGNRPVIDGAGAVTPATMNPSTGKSLFTVASDAVGSEGAGTIILRRAVNEPEALWKVEHVQIKNLAITGASDENTYVTLAGNTKNYGFSGGVYGRQADWVLVENCLLYGNTLGVFTLVNGPDTMSRCENWTIRSCRVYDNGRIGSNTEHNLYIQGLKFTTEFNFIGQNRQGSGGSSIKTRTGQDIIRFNWIEAHSRGIDFVELEEQIPFDVSNPDHAPNKPYYGIDYCYGNVIINDSDLPSGASFRPIHYGADNAGEQTDGGAAFIPGPTHRKKLYFFNNTVISNVNGPGARNFIFQVSARDIVVELWNNIFYLTGNVPLHWTQHAGTLNFRGTNLVYRSGGTLTNAQFDANPANVLLNFIGTIIQSDPLFASPLAASRDLTLSDVSPAVNVATGLPAGIPAELNAFPVEFQPRRRANGSVVRSVIGAGSDLGAFEYDPLAPPDAAPTNVIKPTIPSTAVLNESISVTNGSWLRMGAGTFSYQWQISNSGAFQNIAGATDQSYTPTIAGDIRCAVTATNIVGSTTEFTDICVVSDGVILAPTTANIRERQNEFRDVGAPAGIIASVEPTTNFLIFTTESFEPPAGSTIDFFGNPYAQYVEFVTTVKCADARYLHVWKALNVPVTIGADIQLLSYPTNGYASAITVEIPGNILVGTPVTSPELSGTDIQSSLITVTTPSLLVSANGTSLSTNGVFTWGNGFTKIAALEQLGDSPRMNTSVATRIAGAGSYRSRVTLTSGLQSSPTSGLVILPVSFV